jgi:hypothetical protein
MAEYLVERYLPGITPDAVREATARLARAMRAMASEGTVVHHLHCTFVAEEEAVLCVFRGPSSHAVEEANRRAEFAFDRVIEATDVKAV